MSGRCPGVENKVRWTLACTDETGVLASRSHSWHLHLVAFADERSPSPAPRLHCSDGGKARAHEAMCTALGWPPRRQQQGPDVQRGVVQNKEIRHSITVDSSGKAIAFCNWVWAKSTLFLWGYTFSSGVSLTCRTVLWCVLQRAPVSYSSPRQTLGLHQGVLPALIGILALLSYREQQ